MQDNELLLFDRLNVIKDTIKKYGEDNFYIAYSGGKDSSVLSYLIDLAIPNNKIPRVYTNTGIEYNDIVQFVKDKAEVDSRFIIITPKVPIKQTLEKYGYPFKSKEHSLRVEQFNKGLYSNYIKKYLTGYDKNGKPSSFVCPKILKYQFDKVGGGYNYSNKCCYKMKKEPMHKWSIENKKPYVITGMLAEEGGNRKRLGCIITDNKGKLLKFHPLIKVNKEFEDWFINKYDIKLCKLYYPPYNFQRTGCKGCPYSLTLQFQLETMAMFLPSERKQCEIIWEPVYKEYRRIGYRLKDKTTIWD